MDTDLFYLDSVQVGGLLVLVHIYRRYASTVEQVFFAPGISDGPPVGTGNFKDPPA